MDERWQEARRQSAAIKAARPIIDRAIDQRLHERLGGKPMAELSPFLVSEDEYRRLDAAGFGERIAGLNVAVMASCQL